MALPWNFSLFPECHLQQNVFLYVTLYRPCSWVSLWQNISSSVTCNKIWLCHSSPCPWVSPLTEPVLILGCHISKRTCLVSWVSSPDRMYLLFPGSAHNKVWLCLLGIPSRKESVTWVSSPMRTYPCLVCLSPNSTWPWVLLCMLCSFCLFVFIHRH